MFRLDAKQLSRTDEKNAKVNVWICVCKREYMQVVHSQMLATTSTFELNYDPLLFTRALFRSQNIGNIINEIKFNLT